MKARSELLQTNPPVHTGTPPVALFERALRPEGTIVTVRGLEIGGCDVVVMAGPCAVESEEQILTTAHAVQTAGAHILRGGAFKPRTSPYSLVEVHADPSHALSDGPQSLDPLSFRSMMDALEPVARAVGRTIAATPEPAYG